MNRRHFLRALVMAPVVAPPLLKDAMRVKLVTTPLIRGEITPPFTSLFDRAIAKAKSREPRIWPVRIGTRDYYAVVLPETSVLLARARA